ncbi:MAG: hypothetical protein ACRDJ1_00660 [Actinomycetota bacterium]
MRAARSHRTIVRAFAGPIILVLLAGSAYAGPADTKTKISEAKARLKELEARISAEQAHIGIINDQLKISAADVAQSRRIYDAIVDRLARIQIQKQQTEDRYQALRAEIDAAASAAYIRGPGYALEAMLELKSLDEVSDLLTFTNAIAARNAELADAVRSVAFELQRREQEEAALQLEQQDSLTRLTEKQRVLTERFIDQQQRIAGIARDHAEVRALLARLQKQLRAEELAAALEALRHGTPLTFGQWAEFFLKEMHAPVARNNLVVVVAWQVAEYTSAQWNPLATTYPMPGATEFNSHGVRNYVSLEQGLDASRLTLSHCCYGYEAIIASLARNADPMTTGQAINDSRWCRGCADGGYVIDLIPTVEEYYDEYAGKSA